MKNWQITINKFLDQWKDKTEFEGAILSGSYAVGLQSVSSDIDIMIVLSEGTKWWQRGNQVVDGLMVEYIADPVSMWRKAFEDNYNSRNKVSISMFAVGKVLFDRNGTVSGLKKEAELFMKKPYKKMETREIEMAKYHLWDGIEKLRNLFEKGFVEYAPLYYLHLSKILNFYANFVRISVPAVAKTYRFLNDAEFKGKYKLEGFTDMDFVSLMNDCLKNYSSLGAIETLNAYVINKLGGFEPNGWVLKTEIKDQ